MVEGDIKKLNNAKPVFLPLSQKKGIKVADKKILSADIGGTKTNLALFQVKEGSLDMLCSQLFPTREFSSFQQMLKLFLNKWVPNFDSLSIGFAGPVINGKAEGTNFSWGIDKKELARQINNPNVYLMNDMEANAYGLAALENDDLLVVNDGIKRNGNIVLVSPGTGLGEAGLIYDGHAYHPFASEGGHCDFAPRSLTDSELWLYMHQKYDHVSWERVVSGPGIYDIYQFLRDVKGETEPDWLRQKLSQTNKATVVISKAALDNKCIICKKALSLFIRYLAIEIAQFALKIKAHGGVFIGGGIVPKILDAINTIQFLEDFTDSGRMSNLLKEIPVNIVLNEQTPLLGAAYYGAFVSELKE